jgi:hypothetical protein
MPLPATEELIQRVVEQYAEAERRLLARMARSLAQGLSAPDWATKQYAALRTERLYLERMLDALQKSATEAVKSAITEAYEAGGLKAAREAVRAGAGEIARSAELPAKTYAVERMTAETMGYLTATEPRILRSSLNAYQTVIAAAEQEAAQATFREAIAEGVGQALLGAETRRTACQLTLDRFASKGITGFIDAAGRSWDLASYTEMATRTALMKSARIGHSETLQEHGIDLVIISDHRGACPLCAPWEGRVLSLSGNDPRYPSLAEAEAAGLFHPGCGHDKAAYQEGITEKPKKKTTKELEEENEEYKARQKQRYLERQVRAAKRMEAAGMDDAAQRKVHARVRAYQEKLREHVEEHDLRRLYHREQIGKAH